MAGDRAVHQRLGEGRLVALVVAVAPVAKQVDDDVLLEFLTVFDGDAGRRSDRFRVVAVDVQDRRLDPLGDIRRVGARPRGRWARGKADLVVDDEMQRAAGREAVEFRQFERLGDETLAGKGGVAMHQDAGDPGAGAVARLLLLGADLAEHDRIDRFEMRRVGGERQVHRHSANLAVARGAEMVFDVARALDVVRVDRIALEFGEDRGDGLADEIGEHVEPAAMRHADHEFAEAELGAAPEDRFERRHQQLGAFEAKPLGAGVTAIEEALEGLGPGQARQNSFPFGRGRRRPGVPPLEFVLEEGAFGQHLNMHVLDADPAAIGLAQQRQELAQTGALAAEQMVEPDLAVEIAVKKPVGPVVELGLRGAPIAAERVEIGFEMAAHPVGADQLHGADRVRRSPGAAPLRRSPGRVLRRPAPPGPRPVPRVRR